MIYLSLYFSDWRCFPLSNPPKPSRYALLDSLRGLALVSMVLYHGCWNLVNLFGMSLPFMQGTPRFLWRQSICWTFILLSGFCFSLSRRHLRHILQLLALSAVVSLVTYVLFPEHAIWFGILFLMGASALLLWALQAPLSHCPPPLGLLVSFFLFALLYHVQEGSISLLGKPLASVPQALYDVRLLTPLGFPHAGFYSTDYYPLLPWFFLYLCGYFLYKWLCAHPPLPTWFSCRIRPLAFLGRHSLLIYILHQPLLLGVQMLYFAL